MFVALDCIPIVILLLIPLGLTIYYKLVFISLVLTFFIGFVLFFFRDPKRDIKRDENTIYAPADGTILEVENISFLGEDYLQVVIFMSVFNVHINRSPFAGKIISKKYVPGKFLFANEKDVTKENERMEILMDTKEGRMKFIQVAGFIARKIVCRLTEGQEVIAGEKFGLIKFGSRMDVLFPARAKCLVKIGDKTKGGITKIAEFT
ncbi:phosphatidylserine decarboxylase [Candidatus Margulisiibacteriota bacterium]